MYKVLLALEVAEAFSSGSLRPDAELRVAPNQQTPGGTGLNQFANPVSITVRDLLFLALAWSDNTASDVLLGLVGLDAIHERAQQLGLSTVRIIGDCRTLLRNAGTDFGYASEEEARHADWAPPSKSSDLVLERTTRASVADLVQLGDLLATDEAANPEACRLVRDLMKRQAWKSRFAEAFPSHTWARHSKTGSLSPWRGEFGIVRRSDGPQLSVAVVVRQHDPSAPNSLVDAVVRDAAAQAAACALGESEA